MKKISQGEYEIFTTKAVAIDRFMQMQGVCREEISGETPIQFYCSKKGKIVITNPPTRRVEGDNSTELFADIVEKDGKTYVTYYTVFDTANNILKMIFLTMYFILTIVAIILAITKMDTSVPLIVLIFCLIILVSRLFSGSNEKSSSYKDSEIMINELEKRVKAVNLWDK